MSKFKKSDIYNFRQLFFLDQFLQGHKGFIAGGCFKNIIRSEKTKDIDVFFQSKADFEEAKRYFLDLCKKDSDGWKLSYENKKVWAVYSVKNKIRIELIRSVFGKPEKIINDFDFTVTKFAYYKNYENLDEEDYLAQFEVLFHEDYFEHLQMKRLVLDNNIPFPISTFNRSYKYKEYGFGLCKESKVKLLKEINELDFVNEAELGKSLYEGKD